jgi:arylsulfatase A-like enzyme
MRNSLLWFLTLTLFVSCSKISERPNFIIILTDDQGWGDLELTGNPVLKTPNLNNLADTGSLFNSFYVSPVCSPTRSEILTGNYHPRTGVIDVSEGGERINLDQKLISDYFKEKNYNTAFFGKWHNGQQYPYHPNSRGFDEFIGYCSGHIGEYFNAELEHNGEFFKSDGYLTDYITENTIEFIETNGNSPFFVFYQ